MQTENNRISKILVVDDQEDNIDLVTTNLEMEGFQLSSAMNGREGFDSACRLKPDIIILDIMMPVMDGWEACRLLKENETTKNIPIIILTAKTGIKDVINGFNQGALDYLRKPFHVEELISRVKKIIHIKEEKKSLESVISYQEQIIQEKNLKFLEVAPFEVMGKMVGSIGHDLSNLLSCVKGNNQLAGMSDSMEEVKKYLEAEKKAIDMMKYFIESLRNFTLNKKSQQEFFSPLSILQNTIKILQKTLNQKKIQINISTNNMCQIFGDPGQYSQICLNIILNAIDAMEKEGTLKILIERDNHFIISRFQDTGSGIHPDNLDKIFNLSFTTKAKKKGTGIGLYTVNEIIKKAKGKMTVQSNIGKGSIFSFWFPTGKDQCSSNMNHDKYNS